MTRFKVGDRIIVAQNPHRLEVKLKIGSVGTVTGHSPDRDYINIKWDENDSPYNGNRISWSVDRFNLLAHGVVVMEDTRDYLAIISNEQPL